MLSKELFAKYMDDVQEVFNQRQAKYADATATAGLTDASNDTVTRIFSQAMIIAQPMSELETTGVIEVVEAQPQDDKVVFTVITGSSLTWTTVDTRGAEVTSEQDTQKNLEATYATATPLTKSATIAIADNIDLVNPVQFSKYVEVAGEQIKVKKIIDGIAELALVTNYTAATSIRNANGFTTKAAVAADDLLKPADLVSAKIDLKASNIIADVVLVHTNQKYQLETSSDFSPGQSANANYKKAKFDETGTLISFDGMSVYELAENELEKYLDGDLKIFTIPLDIRGSPFQLKVWNALLQIKYVSIFPLL